MADLMEALRAAVAAIPAELRAGKKGACEFERLVAERKAFLSRKRLVYRASFRLDDQGRKLHFTEALKESGFGLSSGGGDMEMSAGAGFRKGVYRSGTQGLEGGIEEQSRLFGKDYKYSFDYGAVRNRFREIADEFGYAFEYHILGLGE
jgi:hypothetical protein